MLVTDIFSNITVYIVKLMYGVGEMLLRCMPVIE